MARRTTGRQGIKWGDGFLTERTTQAGDVRYQARWRDPDTDRWRAKTFASREDAEDHLRETGRDTRAGRYAAPSALTVAALLDAYIDRGRSRWTTNTVATYRLLARRQIGPMLGTVRAAELAPARVQRWLDGLTGQLSPAVIENARTVLSGACREAVRLGIIPTNPVTGTTIPTRTRTKKTIWTTAEVARVFAATRDDPRIHAYYVTALTTGMRPGELRALQWPDIDLDAGVVTVQRTMTRTEDYRHTVGQTTKTGRVRTIALPPETVTALREHRHDQRERHIRALAWADIGIVFDRGDGNPIAQQSMQNTHVRVCERANVRRCRMHDLRHAAAELLIRAGVNVKVVSEILGHSSISTTMDIYVSVADDLKVAASESLRAVLFEARESHA